MSVLLPLVLLWSHFRGLVDADHIQGCFGLPCDKDKPDWGGIQESLNLTPRCPQGTNTTVRLNRLTYSIPVFEKDWCNSYVLPQDNKSLTVDAGCVFTNVPLCEGDFNFTAEQRRSCNGEQSCTLTLGDKGLGSSCKNRIEYGCFVDKGEQVTRCTSRLVNVEYSCIMETAETPSLMDMTSQSPRQPHHQNLIIGLTAAVGLSLVLMALISIFCCLRYRRLQQTYHRHRLLSDHGEDEPTGHVTSVPFAQYKASSGNKDTVQICEAGNGTETAPANTNASKPKTKQNYENIPDMSPGTGQPDEYRQVERDLKRKNRPQDIDPSNAWHDPDKDGVVAKAGKVAGSKGDRYKGRDGYEDVEMVKNQLYEGQHENGEDRTDIVDDGGGVAPTDVGEDRKYDNVWTAQGETTDRLYGNL